MDACQQYIFLVYPFVPGDISWRTYRPSVRLSVRSSVRPSDRPSVLTSIRPSGRPPARPSVCPSVNPSLHSSLCSLARPSVRPSLRPSIPKPFFCDHPIITVLVAQRLSLPHAETIQISLHAPQTPSCGQESNSNIIAWLPVAFHFTEHRGSQVDEVCLLGR